MNRSVAGSGKKAVSAKVAPTARAKPAKPPKPAAASVAKTRAAVEPKPKARPVAEPKEKIKKTKLVRDSFTMPEAEYQVLADVKKACLKAGVAVKKSELLRIGVALIRKLDLAELKKNLAGLVQLKAGRPKREK